ncbi:MAG: hypothetical protein VZQ48_03855 [Candidatus Cryptobacteroides sp.]|nr:hypothetical protein [Candidatus Cryptobacteroides sp.]
MKKMYILALAALAMAFSCQKTEKSPEPASEPVVRTFTCTFAQPDTKLAINDTNGKTTWEVGDKILIHGKATSENVTVTLTSTDISADAKTATFSAALPATAYDPDGYYAAYPADAYIEYSSDRGYYYNTFDETNLPLMSAYLSGDSFLFFNLCGAISFVVDGDYDQYVFSGNNGETVGYDRYNVKILSNEKNYCRVSGTEGTVGAKTSITASVTADGTTVNRVFFPNGANFTGGFTIKFLKGGSIVKTLSTTKSVDVPRNSYCPMGDVTAYLKDYVAPTSHDSSIDMTGATALDGSGNANCYIVDGSVAANAEKVFTFKAYKGNGTTGVGTVASTVVLWETWNNTETVTAKSVIAAVDFDKQDANDYYTIVFKMPATLHAGNAVIAAKDAGDNILWSWHIWVPATAISTPDGTELVGVSKIQDRNLGALVATAASGDADPRSIGLYYQWGRKDPFPSNSAFSGSTPISVAGSAMIKHDGLITTAYSIEHPTAYAYVYSVDNSDWNEDHPTDLWIPASKSIYDPCPPGYRVPARDDTKPMFTLADTGWDYSAANRFSYGNIVFPIAGYIDCWGASYANVGVRSHVWSATYRGETTAYCMYFRSDKTPKMYASNFIKAKAGSVRCVAE